MLLRCKRLYLAAWSSLSCYSTVCELNYWSYLCIHCRFLLIFFFFSRIIIGQFRKLLGKATPVFRVYLTSTNVSPLIAVNVIGGTATQGEDFAVPSAPMVTIQANQGDNACVPFVVNILDNVNPDLALEDYTVSIGNVQSPGVISGVPGEASIVCTITDERKLFFIFCISFG